MMKEPAIRNANESPAVIRDNRSNSGLQCVSKAKGKARRAVSLFFRRARALKELSGVSEPGTGYN